MSIWWVFGECLVMTIESGRSVSGQYYSSIWVRNTGKHSNHTQWSKTHVVSLLEHKAPILSTEPHPFISHSLATYPPATHSPATHQPLTSPSPAPHQPLTSPSPAPHQPLTSPSPAPHQPLTSPSPATHKPLNMSKIGQTKPPFINWAGLRQLALRTMLKNWTGNAHPCIRLNIHCPPQIEFPCDVPLLIRISGVDSEVAHCPFRWRAVEVLEVVPKLTQETMAVILSLLNQYWNHLA